MRNWLRWWLLATLCWWLVLLPKHYALFDTIRYPFQRFGYGVIDWAFGAQLYYEDTKGMYLLLLVCPVLAIPFGFVPKLKPLFSGRISRFFTYNPIAAIHSIMRWFLVFELLEYGWIKVTKMQFYLPEPNTVYTEFGHLSKDIAWWSVMGSSPSYVIFMGVIELLAGVLILVRKTRFLGLLLALGIFVQVVIVNFSFDISVKLFSVSLLVMTIVLLTAYPHIWRAIFQLPVKHVIRQEVKVPQWRNWTRALLLALIITETVYPSVTSGNWYDDAAPRPSYHGAYAVQNGKEIRHFYVHRHGYLIVENEKDEQYSLRIVSQEADWVLLDEQTGEKSLFRIRKEHMNYVADWKRGTVNRHFLLKKLPYGKLPLLSESFHWFSDSYH